MDESDLKLQLLRKANEGNHNFRANFNSRGLNLSGRFEDGPGLHL